MGFKDNVKKYKEAEGMQTEKPVARVAEKKDIGDKSTTTTKRIKQFSIEAEIDDMPKLNAALVTLINRDNILYKKKDVHIAMIKNFLELVEKDIKNVKIERH